VVEKRVAVFFELCEKLYLEVEHGVMTLDEDYTKLKQWDPSPDQSLSHSKKWLKSKLQEKYLNTLYFTSKKRRDNIQANIPYGNEKANIIKTAMRFICNDIATADLDTK